MESVADTHDAVANDANVMSSGLWHKITSARNLTMTMNSGTVRKSGNVSHLRIRSFWLAVSISRCLLDGDIDILFVLSRIFQLAACRNETRQDCSSAGSGIRGRAGPWLVTLPSSEGQLRLSASSC
jgi:hypothetical protein